MSNKVLIVDDSPLFQASMSALIKRLGFETEICGDGVEAIPLLNQKRDEYIAVLLDIYMPQLDGVSLLGHIRNKWPELSVIVLSGSYDPADEKLVLQHGARGYIKKLFPIDEMYPALKELLGAKDQF